MTLLDFIRRFNHVLVDFDGSYGPQCVDLVNQYLRLVRGTVPVTGNASDIAHQTIAGARWIANSPTNAPSAGDVVVWRPNVSAIGLGPFGHTAIALAANADTLVSFDQNWPGGSPCSLVVHSYTGIAGWHHFATSP